MTEIIIEKLPEKSSATFFFAVEEYIAKCTDLDHAMLMWQVPPSVFLGRNQDIGSEVNLPFCRQNDIEVSRRKSGGGCVYADMGQVMVSLIVNGVQVERLFADFMNMVNEVLRRNGLDTVVGGRNDISIDGKKISGSAFHKISGRDRSIMHCTILYDTDLYLLKNSLTPSDSKLKSKSIDSVRQRVGRLKDYTDLSLEKLIADFKLRLCNDRYVLNDLDMQKVEEIRSSYTAPAFILGSQRHGSHTYSQRVEGVGEICIQINVNNNLIQDFKLSGDYFDEGNTSAALERFLVGQEISTETLAEKITQANFNQITNLTNIQLSNLIIQAIKYGK